MHKQVVILAILLSQAAPALAQPVDDVSGHWAAAYIVHLQKHGIIANAGSKFRPDDPVTRADFAIWFARVLRVDKMQAPATPSYPDVKPGDRYFGAAEVLRMTNYMNGYADGFRPNQCMSRAEVMSLISRPLLHFLRVMDNAAQIAELACYDDAAKVPEWALAGMALDARAGILTNKNPKVLSPMSVATRGETAALLARLNDYLDKHR